MERAQRIARINVLLQQPRGVTMNVLMRELEVSRATICRDIEFMRDQMNAPIQWDRGMAAYRLGSPDHAGPSYMVPGLWLSPAQAYAYLTLHNMVEKIAPRLLGPFLEPMRLMLKQMLCEAEFPFYGLDSKIDIQMPPMPRLGDRDFGLLLDALVHTRPVHLVTSRSAPDGITGIPAKLQIKPDRWLITLQAIDGQETQIVDVASILRVEDAAPP